MPNIVEKAVTLRGLNHAIPNRELRFEAHFDPNIRGLQHEVLQAIAKMTVVAADSVKYDGRILKLRIYVGKTPEWKIPDKLNRAEEDIIKTVTAVAKNYSPPHLTLVGGSKHGRPPYRNTTPHSLRRK